MNIQQSDPGAPNHGKNGHSASEADFPDVRHEKGKKVRFTLEDVPFENEHYIAVSKRFKIAKYIVLVILIVYILAMIALRRDDITVENFRYMIKYLDNTTSEYDGEYNTIYYNSDGGAAHAYYKGELAVVSSTEMNLFSMTGISDLNMQMSYVEPKLIPSEKYLMVYDFFGNSYSLYNSFSQLYSETLDYPISGAAVCDTGMYAIVSKTREYRCAVIFYDKNFNRISQVLKEKYVMDVALKDDGSEALIVSAYNSNGGYRCEIMNINPYSEESASTVIYDDRIPLVAGYNGAGGYTVVCNDVVMVYSSDRLLLNEYDFGGLTLSKCDVGDFYTAVALSQNVVVNENKLIFFNSNGKAVYQETVKGEILDIKTDKNFAYIAFDGKILKIDLETGESGYCTVDKNCNELLLVSDSMILVCYSNRSVAIENTSKSFGMEVSDVTGAVTDTGTETEAASESGTVTETVNESRAA